jgi:prepilin-type N-terminal cleavage/methylation domain-containing protein
MTDGRDGRPLRSAVHADRRPQDEPMSNRENWKAGMREPKHRRRRVAGFTLIEIVVALAIIGLLAAIAYPSFMSSVRRGNHTDAQAAITRLTNNLERFFATNGTYTTDVTQLGFVLVGGTAYSDDPNAATRCW